MLEEFELFETVERLTPGVFAQEKGETKVICANVDMYSGLVYKMMGIPPELYTPLFAIARMSAGAPTGSKRCTTPATASSAPLTRPWHPAGPLCRWSSADNRRRRIYNLFTTWS